MMLWAILAILGVPIWLVVGGLSAALWSRARFKKQDGVFPAKMRRDPDAAEGGGKWPPVSSYALWVHDVLLVHKGLGLMQTIPLGVTGTEGVVEKADPEEAKRLGENPMLLRFRLDDGVLIELAVPGESLALAQGPFG